jgi:hypothetical protein
VGRHFLDLEQARTLPTPGLVATDRAVADLLEARAMGVVHGMAGLGKTYAVEQALTRAGKGRCVGRRSPVGPRCARSRPGCMSS